MPRKDSLRATQAASPCEKPFPRRCPECGKAEVQPATIAYDAEVKHDGRLHTFHIPHLQVNKCGACGEVLFGNVADDQIQSRAMDNLMRLFFAFDTVRAALPSTRPDKNLGVSIPLSRY